MTLLRWKQHPNRVALLLILLLSAITLFIITRQIFAYQNYPFDSDEANHANSGLALYLEMQTNDVGGFVHEFYNQKFYPPLASSFLALFFLLFSPTIIAARLFSTVALFLAMPVVLVLNIEIDEKMGWLGGIIAVILTLSAQPILINSSLAMLEAPGLLITLLFLCAYMRALKQPSRLRWLLTSGLLAATFLTKYTFGVFTLVTILLMELSFFFPILRKDQHTNRFAWFRLRLQERWLWLFGPFFLVMVLWLGNPAKLSGFLGFTRPLADSEPWLTTANLLFYPRSFVLHYAPAPLFVLVTAVALVWSFFNWRNVGIRLLLIYFISGMLIIMLVNHPQNPRFIATVAPAAHILTGAMLAHLFVKWRTEQKSKYTAVVLAIAGIALITLSFLSVATIWERLRTYPSVMEAAYETSPETNELATWIIDQIPNEKRFFIVNYWDRFSPQTLAWYLGTNSSNIDDFDDLLMPATILQNASPQNQAAFANEVSESGVDYVVVLSGGPWGAAVWPEYTNVLAEEFTPIAMQTFRLEQYGGRNWLNNSLLNKNEWEKVKADSQYFLDIEAAIYRAKG